MCHCVKFHPIFYHLTMCFFVLKVKQTHGISLPRYKTIVGFKFTRAFKNILNVLGTYFECEGVECTYFSCTCGDHGNVCSSKKPKFTAKYGLHHTWWLHTWPIRNGSHVYDVHVQRFQYSNEQTDKHPETSMSLLEAKPKPYGDFLAEKCIFEPFYRNTDACCCFCCCFLCHC